MTEELVRALLSIAIDAIKLAAQGHTITSADVSKEVTKLQTKLDKAAGELQRIHQAQWQDLSGQ